MASWYAFFASSVRPAQLIEQPDVVVANGEVGPRAIRAGVAFRELAENLPGLFVRFQRLGMLPEQLRDRPDLGVGDGPIAMEGGIVAGEIDELVVVTQGIFQSPLPKPLRSRHLGQFFRIAHAEIVQQQACIAEVRFEMFQFSSARVSAAANLRFAALVLEFACTTKAVLAASATSASTAKTAADRTTAW